jgi:hypothetical protein
MAIPMPRQAGMHLLDERFDTSGLLSDNNLARHYATSPDSITQAITFMMGSWKSTLPLTQLTEGQFNRGMKTMIPISGIEYEYPVVGKRRTTSRVKSASTTNNNGLNNSNIMVVMEDNWIPYQSTVRTASGAMLRVHAMPQPHPGGGYLYTLRAFVNDSGFQIPYSDIAPGSLIGIAGAPKVSNQQSVGNSSNIQMPGKRKNQLSIIRKSYRLAGNVKNSKVLFNLPTKGGGTTNLWLDYAEFLHWLEYKEQCELDLWTSVYNRNANGEIALIDDATGHPIPTTAGLMSIIPNEDSFGRSLSETRLRNIISEVFRGSSDTLTGKMELVIFSGKWGLEEIDRAMKSANMYVVSASDVGKHFVRETNTGLQLGGYFTSYRHIDGHTIHFKHLPFLDEGGYADVSPRHPQTGAPLTSYEMYFIDMSVYDNQPNIVMTYQEGRKEIRGIHQGMTLLKGQDFGDYKGNDSIYSAQGLYLSTEKDETSIHFLSTKGLQVFRDTQMFKLSPGIAGV